MIRRDHRGAIGRHQIAEQPQLGVQIMRDIGMVIHVVAREIGEAAGGDPHAVEPVLVEPVRRGLEREMGDAVAGDVVELPVQRDRIRRGQRAVDGALRRHQPDGADAGRFVAEPLPDLAREGGDRGLAAGAGDRRDGLRLPRIEFRRRQRQRAARVRRGDEGHADVARRRMIAGDRHRARGNRRIDEARAIGLGCRPARRTGRPASPRGCPAPGPTPRPLPACGGSVASSLKRSRSLIIFQSGRRAAPLVDLKFQGNSQQPLQELQIGGNE